MLVLVQAQVRLCARACLLGRWARALTEQESGEHKLDRDNRHRHALRPAKVAERAGRRLVLYIGVVFYILFAAACTPRPPRTALGGRDPAAPRGEEGAAA